MGKPVPHYWWDPVWDWNNNRIVGVAIESSYVEFNRVAFFPLGPDEPYDIPKYQQMIEDLKAGRLDPRKLAAELKKKEATRG